MRLSLTHLLVVLGLSLVINTSIYSITFAAGKWKVGYKVYPNGKTYYSTSSKENFADAKAFHKCKREGYRGAVSTTDVVCLKFKIIDPKGKTQKLWKQSVSQYNENDTIKAVSAKSNNLNNGKNIEYCNHGVEVTAIETTKSKFSNKSNCSLINKSQYPNLYSNILQHKLPYPRNCSYRPGLCKFKSTYFIETKILNKYLITKGIGNSNVKIAEIKDKKKIKIREIEYCDYESKASSIEINKSKFSNKPNCNIVNKEKYPILYSELLKKKVSYPRNCNKEITNTGLMGLCKFKSSYYISKKELNKSLLAHGIDALNTKIAKKNSPTKLKKTVEVSKKESSNQEKFLPKEIDQDNDPPIIKIASAITVNDASYEFQGKVTDKAKLVFVEIDGRAVEVKGGKFTVKGYSPVDKEITIEAIDQWGNRSKPKIVKLTIDIKDTNLASILEPLNPLQIKTNTNNDRVALIIGIEKYDRSPDASFANLDAKYFYEYARKGFGISKSNIKLLIDEDANLIQSLATINKWLPGKVKSGQTDLVIFFAGHGLASNNGEELYLLSQDSDPDLLSRTALSRTELFAEIMSLNPKSVTLFLDTCYSGVSREEETLLASARPVRIVADEQDTPDNFTIFSASQLDQISSGLSEAKHGIFSYYLMKGLEGNADINQDKKITNGELLAYMNENVSEKAAELGREQNPSLTGDPEKVLISYR